ncbi:MAG: transcriptional regulator [Candidatus Dormibacteraeota bacterium]|nr:transcriptional regulator [Candidatus Dormibacteraeota bacterium]
MTEGSLFPIRFAHRFRIAIVGPDDLVERSMLAEHRKPQGFDWRLIAAGYREEHQTSEILRGLEGRIDGCLFTGPLPYDIARQEGSLHVPASYVPLNDAALYRTLLGGVREQRCDPTRISVDTLSREDVEEAYAEIETPVERVAVHPYTAGERASAIAAFHEAAWKSGSTTAAVTCIRSVWQLLQAAGVPSLRVLPTQASVRAALRTVVLMGVGSHLADAQIAVAIVQVPSPQPGRERPGLYWHDELRLSLHQLLLSEARRMDATVQPFEDRGFLLVTTVGALAASTNDFRTAPFLERIRRDLGVGAFVGVGLGRSAWEAAAGADRALVRARESGSQGFAMSSGEQVLLLSGADGRPLETASREQVEALQVLSRLVKALDEGRGREQQDSYVVDAQEVAGALLTTERTARRNLQLLAEQGLAWPLPADRTTQPGRPRRRYRLTVERLPDGGVAAG